MTSTQTQPIVSETTQVPAQAEIKPDFENSLLLEDKAVDLCAIKSSFNTNNNIPF